MENSMEIHVDGNKLIGSNFEMTFENYIEEIIVYERHYFILVSICDKIENGVSVRDDILDNVYCIDKTGKIVWRVKLSPPPNIKDIPQEITPPLSEKHPATHAFVGLRFTKKGESFECRFSDNMHISPGNELLVSTYMGTRFIIDKETGKSILQLVETR